MGTDVQINIKLISKQAQEGLKRLGSQSAGTKKKLTTLQLAVKQVSGSMDSFVGNLASSVVQRGFSFFVGQTKDAITNVIDLERALIGVGKTTNLSGKELNN